MYIVYLMHSPQNVIPSGALGSPYSAIEISAQPLKISRKWGYICGVGKPSVPRAKFYGWPMAMSSSTYYKVIIITDVICCCQRIKLID